MTNSMRDKIADICQKEIQYTDPSPYTIADDIIAALPGMVPPLEWHKRPEDQVWYAMLPEIEGHTFERGYMILPESSHFTLYNGFLYRAQVIGQFTLADEAKAAANKHHVEQLMKGLGL